MAHAHHQNTSAAESTACYDGLNHALPVSGGTGAAVSGDLGESVVGS